MPAPIDSFLPYPDVRKRHEIVVHAPADLVLDTARTFDLFSLAPVRAIFRLRAWAMRARTRAPARPGGLVDQALGMGWGALAEEEGRYFVAGAACQPWVADVVFTPIPPDRFAAFCEPDRVKVAWTLEVEALGPVLTRFATETRAAGTDPEARRQFLRYWRVVVAGIVGIRWLLLPALRREAERRWRASSGRPG